MEIKGQLKWKSEEEQKKELKEIEKTRNREKFGNDGYVTTAEGTFEYRGVKYLVKVLRYFVLSIKHPIRKREVRKTRFTTLSNEKSEEHAVVEYPEETEWIVKMCDKDEFLYHDTIHVWNEGQSINEKIKVCHELAKDDIDYFLDGYPSKIDSMIEKLKKDKERILELKR